VAPPVLVDRIDPLDEDSCSSSLTDLCLEGLQDDADLRANAASFNKAASRTIGALFKISSFIPEHDSESKTVTNTELQINETWAS